MAKLRYIFIYKYADIILSNYQNISIDKKQHTIQFPQL